MAITDHLITRTITDLAVIAYTGGSLGSTLVDMPGIQSCQITLANESAELRGDNRVLAIHDQGNTLEFQFESGGMDLEVLEIILGGTTTDTGSTPNEIRTWKVLASDERPYFGFVGITPADDGGVLQVFVPRAKASGNYEFQMQDQEFAVPSISGMAIEHATHGLVQFRQFESPAAAAIPS